MKIAVIGAPGSGKSEFAEGLAKVLNGDTDDWVVVDNYAQELQEKTDLALGPWATYSENFMIAGHRMAAETYPLDTIFNTITVGTILETLAYTSVIGEIRLGLLDYEETFIEAQAALSGLGVIYGQTWDYVLSFYLPLENPKPESWESKLDVILPRVAEAFFVPYVYELKGTTEERVKVATEIIEIAEEKVPAEDPVPEADELPV